MLSSCTWGEYDDKSKDVLLEVFEIEEKGKVRKKHVKSRFIPAFIESLNALVKNKIQPYYSKINKTSTINWNNYPDGVNPDSLLTNLPISRKENKTYQVNNMLLPTIAIVNAITSKNLGKSLKIVEFCSGSGYIGLPLAYLYPQHEIILIDKKELSLDIAKQRCKYSKNRNIRIIEDDIDLFNESFDVGIALHACGSASDMTLKKCIGANASFIICPCCIGKITLSRAIPLSNHFNDILRETDYKVLVKAADFGHGDLSSYTKINQIRRICKCFIEFDRLLYARSFGYTTHLLLMQPTDASPKNDILIGWRNDLISDISCTITKELDLLTDYYKIEELLFNISNSNMNYSDFLL